MAVENIGTQPGGIPGQFGVNLGRSPAGSFSNQFRDVNRLATTPIAGGIAGPVRAGFGAGAGFGGAPAAQLPQDASGIASSTLNRLSQQGVPPSESILDRILAQNSTRTVPRQTGASGISSGLGIPGLDSLLQALFAVFGVRPESVLGGGYALPPQQRFESRGGGGFGFGAFE